MNAFIGGLGFSGSIGAPLFSSSTILLPTMAINPLAVPKNATLIAWSLGGLYALNFCTKYPTHCKKLILIASTPFFMAQHNWPGILEKDALVLRNLLINFPDQFKTRFLSLVQYPLRSRHLKALLNTQYKIPTLSQFDELMQTDYRGLFSTLTTPTMLYLAEKDAIIPSIQLLPAIQRLNTDVKIKMVPNAPHAYFLDQHEFDYE